MNSSTHAMRQPSNADVPDSEIIPYGQYVFDQVPVRDVRRPAEVVRRPCANPSGRPPEHPVLVDADRAEVIAAFPLDDRAIAIGMREGRRPLRRNGRIERLLECLFGIARTPAKLADASLESVRRVAMRSCRPGFDLERELAGLVELGFGIDRIANVARWFGSTDPVESRP